MEFLVWVIDEQRADVPPTSAWFSRLAKAGDVEAIHEHTGAWGAYFHARVAAGDWRIVPVTGALEDAVQWLQAVWDTQSPPLGPNSLLHRDRALQLDQLQDGMTIAQLQAITTIKPVPAEQAMPSLDDEPGT